MATQSQINGYVQKVTQPKQGVDTNPIIQGYNSYLAKRNQPAKATTRQAAPMAAQTTQATPAAQTNQFAQPMSQTAQTIDRINSFIDKQPYQFSQPGQFEFNHETDPGYIAAMQSARANIQQQQSDTNAMLRAGGQGRSSYSESVANQIGAKEMGRVSTDVLPQLIRDAWTRYQDNENRKQSTELNNYYAQQDMISNLGQLADRYNTQEFTNPITEAGLTGQYLPGNARNLINLIGELKLEAENPNTPPERRSELNQQANMYRGYLTSLGIDASLFGADVNRETALQNTSRAGIPTLQGRQTDWMEKTDTAALTGLLNGQWTLPGMQAMSNLTGNLPDGQRSLVGKQFDQGVTESNRSHDLALAQITGVMPDGTPTSAQQQQNLMNLWLVADQTGSIPDELANMYGLPKGMQTQAALQFAQTLAINQQNANTSAYSAQTSRMSANNSIANSNLSNKFSVWEATGVAPEGIPGVAPGTPLYDKVGSRQTTSDQPAKLSAKDSVDNYNLLLEDLGTPNITYQQANQLLRANKEFLTDADYKKLNDYINQKVPR